MATKFPHVVNHAHEPSYSDNIDALKANILHQHQKSSSNHDHDSQEIIRILGGMNKILTDYLTSNDIGLNREQLIKLQNVLNTNNVIIPDPNSKTENDGPLIYTFNINDTYHHYLFGDKIASKIIHFAYHKCGVIFIAILIAIWNFWFYVFGPSPGWYKYKLIVFGAAFIQATLSALCVNKTVFIKSIQHFVFWFKTIVSIEQAICYFIWRYIMIKDREATYINVFGDIFGHLTLISCVIFFSCIDGHRSPKKVTIAFGLILSTFLTVQSVFYSFFFDQEMQSMVIIGSIKFSVISIYASTLRALSIFLWKQTILMILKGDKCVNIRHSPKIRWIEK